MSEVPEFEFDEPHPPLGAFVGGIVLIGLLETEEIDSDFGNGDKITLAHCVMFAGFEDGGIKKYYVGIKNKTVVAQVLDARQRAHGKFVAGRLTKEKSRYGTMAPKLLPLEPGDREKIEKGMARWLEQGRTVL